ncbi:MAG: glycosyltransferase [Patescibacteria group bacterium]
MKLAIITNLYPPYVRGGAEWLTYLISKELALQGHQVAVITSAPRSAIKNNSIEKVIEQGIAVYRFYPGNIYYYLDAVKRAKPIRLIWQIINLFNKSADRQVKSILQDENPEVVITANLMGLSFRIPKVLRQLKIKHLHIVHDVQLLHPSGLFLVGKTDRGLAISIYQTITRQLFSSPQTVIFPSNWLKQEHEQRKFFPNSNKLVVRNPAALVSNMSSKPKSGNLVMLYVGQAEEHKGIFWLINVLKGIYDMEFKVELVLLGKTGDKERARSLAKDDKRFVISDHLAQDEIEKKYHEASVVIVPSLCQENLPLTIQRAFNHGTPVLASKVGGIPELVQEDKNGWLFKPGDENDFRKKLVTITPSLVRSMRDKIKNNYQAPTLPEYVGKLLTFFQ